MAPFTPDPAIVQLYGAVPPAAEEVLLATAKELALTVPAARDDPYHGLHREDGPSLRLLERLMRDIFARRSCP